MTKELWQTFEPGLQMEKCGGVQKELKATKTRQDKIVTFDTQANKDWVQACYWVVTAD